MSAIAICGRTGQGIETAGEWLADALVDAGIAHRTWRDFSTIIRGGLTSFEIYTATPGADDASVRRTPLDLVVAGDEEGVALYAPRLKADGQLFAGRRLPTVAPDHARDCPRLGFNFWALGIAVGAWHLPPEPVLGRIVSRYSDRANEELFRDGLARGQQVSLREERAREPLVRLTGNQALTLGALQAGVDFYCGYPITPASDILELLAQELPRRGGMTVQVEDEIAAVHMAAGAAYAGRRTFVATSGPGLSLMTEGCGWAAMVEVPLVVVDNQRGGPSTGMPTKTEQSDWEHVLFGGHGEFPHIVLAPVDVVDAPRVLAEAFNLADRYHCLVYVLADLDLVMNSRTAPVSALEAALAAVPIDRGPTIFTGPVADYRRFQPDPDGRLWRTVPGVAGGAYVASGDEHDERGWMEPDFRVVRPTVHRRRLQKVDRVAYDRPWTQIGRPDAPTLLVGTGCVTELIRVAVRHDPERFQGLLLRQVLPLPSPPANLGAVREVVVVEYNARSQLARWTDPWWETRPVRSLLRYDGEHFTWEEFLTALDTPSVQA
jgi:2-oxoglutarate ferredoxin oxidoreductase subunit alpha